MTSDRRLAAMIVACFAMLGCGSSAVDSGPTPSGLGALRVMTTTSGELADIDVDGYEVSGLVRPSPLRLRTGDTLIISRLEAGAYSLDLIGLQSNCVVTSGTVRNIVIPSDSMVDAAWAITCGLIPGSLAVVFEPIAPPGTGAVLLSIDGGIPQAVSAGGPAFTALLPPGVREVTVLGGTPNCQFSGSLNHQITIARATRSELSITGRCSGGRLLFERSRQLWMMNADTTHLHLIPLPTGVTAKWPTLTRDAEWVAFLHGWELYVVRSDGTQLQHIATTPYNSKELIWSPDGSRIAFSGGSPTLNDYELFVINRDGSGLRNVTNSPARDEHPTWSPDGQWIAFTSDRDGGGAPFTERMRVYRISLIDSVVVPIFGPDGYGPDWAPDGSEIAFSHSGLVSLIKVDGTDVRSIPGVWSYLDQARWSPDGRMLVAGNGSDIHFITRDGGSTTVALGTSWISWSQ